MADKVWYASYGSNLLRERFMAYIRGGRPPGARFEQVGCSDRTPPSHDHGVLILHHLFFAEKAPQWDDAGVAFVDPVKDTAAKTLGRMYLISEDQFREVVLQENGYRRMKVDLGLDLEKTVRDGSSELREGLYRRILHLGDEGGHPIFTFTSVQRPVKESINPPGTTYLRLIIRGLRETFGLSDQGIVDYLKDATGIQGLLSADQLARIVRQTIPPYPTTSFA